MEIATVISIVGGVLTVITIIIKKCKCFVHRDINGKYDITFGLLDRQLPINDTTIKND